mgnify:CR=1 FL=1
MNITQAIKMSAKSIFSNKARSALTMLGIIIGLAAVIVLVSYAQGQNMAMQRYYESMGTNKISVSAYDWTGGTDISQSLYDYCLNLSDQVVGFSPTGTVNSAPPIKFGSKTLAQDTNGGGAIIMGGGMAVSGDRGSNYPTLYLGNNQFGQCNDYTIAKGRDLSYLDVKNSSKVCVLGAATADYLFNFANPIDQIITISGTPFRVVGVYSYKGDRSSSASGTEDDQWINQMISGMDKMILLPSTMNRIFNENEPISDYVVKVRSSEDLRPVITGLKGFLSGVIDSNNGFYSVDSNDVYKEQQGDATKMQQNFLGGIAAISLLVGGIGIMNIMLVTVTERTREIGIRRSLGAQRSSIVAQFLIESGMLCGMGGIVGIIFGTIGSLALGKILFQMTIFPATWVTLAAFGLSVALGVLFGSYPAAKASKLQPVEALRAD